jgi:NAD(P)-dependent dehydrogenase (short-subunit alcohol dehydrogenase family)
LSASELSRLADASGDKLRILALDVTDPVSDKAAAEELAGQAIDLLLNNAGVGGVRGQTIGNIDYEACAKVLNVNTMGPMRVSEAFVDHVARSGRKLITITSGMGSIADNTSGGFDRLSHLKGRSEHGDAQPGDRSRSTWNLLRGRQPRLGAD